MLRWFLLAWLLCGPLFVPGPNDPPLNAYWLDGQPAQGFDPARIAECETLVMQLHQPGAEDALLAAGAALAQGKSSYYVVDERSQLPWFLQQADLAYPEHVHVLAPGQSAPAPHRAGPLPEYQRVSQPVDSFIGCLMSRLTADQYRQARTHLVALRTAMQRFGHEHPYCEGINVKSPDQFDTPERALQQDLEALSRADHCLFYLYDGLSRPSGMWVELGAALAWGKPCVLLSPSPQALPPALRQSPPDGLRIVYYSDHTHLLEDLADPDRAQGLIRAE